MNTLHSKQFGEPFGKVRVVFHQKDRLGTELFDRTAIDRAIGKSSRNGNRQCEQRPATDSGARSCQRTVLKSCKARGNRQSQDQAAGRSIASLLLLDERFEEFFGKCALETNAAIANGNNCFVIL